VSASLAKALKVSNSLQLQLHSLSNLFNQVCACNWYGCQLICSRAYATPSSLPSTVVSNISVASANVTSVTLQWNTLSSAVYHVVETKSLTRNDANWTVVASNVSRMSQYTVATYTINNVDSAQQLLFRVRAGTNGIVESGNSMQQIAFQTRSSVPNQPVSSFRIISMNSTAVTLAWDGVPDAFKYKITLKTTSNPTETVINSDFRSILFLSININQSTLFFF
jgi:hypothetical protein